MRARLLGSLGLVLAVACTPAPVESVAPESRTAILGDVYRLRTTTYLTAEEGAPEYGQEFVDHYGAVFPRAKEALLCDLLPALGGFIQLGAATYGVPRREGNRFVYDAELRISIPELATLEKEGRLRLEPDGRFSFSVLRALRTTEGLLGSSCHYDRIPEGLRSTRSVPHGFERIPATLEPVRDVVDAWPRYDQLFGDGVLDLDVHFGVVHDNEEQEVRVGLGFARWLVQQGYAPPAGLRDLEDLNPESGPFTRAIDTPLGRVTVEVRVFFGRRGTRYDPVTLQGGELLADRARESLSRRDAVIFTGHSYGPESRWTTGIVYAAETPYLGLTDVDFATRPLAGRAQVIVSEGCGTVALTEALRGNPSSSGGGTLDLMASATGTVINSDHVAREVVRLLADADGADRHQPRRYLAMLFAVQYQHPVPDQTNVIRVVEFLDDNPTRHPWADVAKAGQPCSGPQECGVGATCLPTTAGNRCALECATTEGCDGLTCAVPIAPGRTSQIAPDEARYCQAL